MITDDELDSSLALCGLTVKQDEKPRLKKQLGQILDYMAVLNKTNGPSKGCEWPDHTSKTLREDCAKSFSDSLIEENAPKFEAHCFSVPKIAQS